jgi:hypothetical protein
MDLVGPAHVRSVGGKLYVLVIVDDYCMFSWIPRMRPLALFVI